ncbi:MAG: L,D-transpeptidase family protein [Chitinophagales bacterium]
MLSQNTVYDTVKTNHSVIQLFSKNGFHFPTKTIYLRAFKQEQILELWASDDIQYRLIKTYKFTATSGNCGPKQREGDLQIPEGFYQIDTFNPNSKFHLSFRINYPNFADSIRNKNEQNVGGDIYIHGGSQTVGCIPIGDKYIEELYFICKEIYKMSAIPIHIFPCKMEEHNLKELHKAYPNQTDFWKSLQPMYRFFQSHKMLGEVTGCDTSGNYQLAIPWD